MATVTATDAVVLRTYSLADADKIVVCLTEKNGLIRGVAKGARKLKSKFGAGLEPFTFIQLTYRAKEDKELVTIQQAEILRAYFNASSDPDVITTWAYLGELILALAPPHEPNPKLYALVRSCMETLALQPGRSREVRNYFSIWLLKLSGLLPGWHSCLRCHRALAPAEGLYIDAQYRMFCAACRPPTARLFSTEAYALLTSTRTLGPAEFARAAEHHTGLDELEDMNQVLLQAAL